MMNFREQNGVIVIITILIVTFLVSMALALSAIFIPKIKASGDIRRSVPAYYAADSAVEWCLYVQKVSIAGPTMANGATYTPTLPAQCISPLQTIGTYQGVSRSLQVTF